MRFLTLTTIAIAVIASVSALPVDSVRDVGQTREDIPLSKRAEQLETSAGAAPPVPGNGQNNGVGAANDVKLEGTPQEKAPLSKRNKKSKDAAGQKNGGGATKPGGTPQEPGSLSKRNKKSKDATADQKNGGGATKPDGTPQEPGSLSKRNKKEKDTAATGQKNGATNDGNVGGTYQDPSGLSKRAEALSGGATAGSGQDGGSQDTGLPPAGGNAEPPREEEGFNGGM